MVRNGNTCCEIWSEPYVPAAYSGIPFLAGVLAVPFFVEEACSRGGAHYGDRVIIFSRKKRTSPSIRERQTGQAATSCGEVEDLAGGPFSKHVVETTTVETTTAWPSA